MRRKPILTLLALAAVWPLASAQTFSGGDGSQSSPYLIKTKADMTELSTAVTGGNTFADKHFRLEGDIAFTTSDSFTPIGYTGTAAPKKFAGEFDGNSHKLSGLEITGTYYAGIFCWLDAAGSIHDLSLDNLGFFAGRMPYLDEVSIGHALICEALYLGLETTIARYQAILAEAANANTNT